MKKYISFFLILAIFLLLQGTLFAQNSATNSNASLVFEEEKFDFGEVSNDTSLTHVFKFENTGTDTLFIKNVRGS